MKLVSSILIRIVFFVIASWPGLAQSHSEEVLLNTVKRLFKVPANEIDLARAKLTIDKLVDPGIDIEATLQRLEVMAEAAQTMAGSQAADDRKLAALRTYIYQAGAWNDHRPFVYDLDDPLGRHIPAKLLPNYLDSRLGNCVSMPFLFIILAARMGLDVTASTAPHHVFVKYTDHTGRTVNLETTSGAHPTRDAWIRRNMPMTDLAIQKGVYLKTLSKRETLVVMAMVLLEHAMEEGRYGSVLNLVNVLLPHYPNYAPLHVARGSAAYKILEVEFYSRYPRPVDIPIPYRGYFEHLNDLNRAAFAQAEALGWMPESTTE